MGERSSAAKEKKKPAVQERQRKLKTIKQLLRKKSRRYWSGEDLGRLLIANMAMWNKANAEGRTHSELLTPNEWNQLISDVKESPREAEVYRRYLGVTYWLQQYTAAAALRVQNIVSITTIKIKELETAQVTEALMRICLYLSSHIIHTTERAKETPDEESEAFAGHIREAFEIYDRLSLEASQSKNNTERKEDVQMLDGQIYRDYRELLAYNKAIELIVEELEIPELDFFMTDMTDVDGVIDELNERVVQFREWLRSTYAADDDATVAHVKDIERTIDGIFPKIDTSHIKLSEHGIEWARRMIQNDMEAFATQNGLFYQALLHED